MLCSSSSSRVDVEGIKRLYIFGLESRREEKRKGRKEIKRSCSVRRSSRDILIIKVSLGFGEIVPKFSVWRFMGPYKGPKEV